MSNPAPPPALEISTAEAAARRASKEIQAALGEGYRYVLIVAAADATDDAFVVSNCDQVGVGQIADMLEGLHAVEVEQ